MRRTCAAKWPSTMKSASAACRSARHLMAGEPDGNREGVDQRRRDHQVARAQRGEHRLAEGPEVDHAARGIEALHGGDRPAGVAKLAVEVVFQHPGAGPGGPGQQRQAAREAHRDTERELV